MGGEQSYLSTVSLVRSASQGRQRGVNENTMSEKHRDIDSTKFTTANTSFEDSIPKATLNRQQSLTNPPSGEDVEQQVESLDLQGVVWEGYVQKKGHLMRNWKKRFFTLEGNLLSYYESKEDARIGRHLKGRVTVIEVQLDNRVKSAHGHDFIFETKEGKHFHLSAFTDLDRRVWVHMMEAGIDFHEMGAGGKPIYGSHVFTKSSNLDAENVYSLYRRVLTDQPNMIPEFLFHFNKDLVLSAYYPKTVPFHGDLFGREGLLYFLATLRENAEMLEFVITKVTVADDGKSAEIQGHEKLRCRLSGIEIDQPWSHYVRFGPHGRIVRLKIDVDLKKANGDWSLFSCRNPYSDEAVMALRSTRSLSINLGDFIVYHVIGKGGFGTVVNAKKKSDGQIYALKILEKSKMTKYDIESSFTEMRVAQNIHHPFIAGLRIAFQSRSKIFLGMNYYAGGDLFHHMSKGATSRIAPSRVRFYTAELILGIHHLHQHDILYRDIKPENVMIDADGHIALVDFGLAKLHVSNYQGAKTMAGSPQYTAPELLLPKGERSYGKVADWWSLGILLYEMSIGKSPFFDSNIERMYNRIQMEDVSFPARPAISDDLKDLILGMLCKDQRERLGNNIVDLLQHKYFQGIDWDLLVQRKIEAPWKPKLSSALDVGYVDSEFTDLDANAEVSSPTQRRFTKGSFIERIGITKSVKKLSPFQQDPTFKDFTYFCEDPDSLVQVSTLVGELHPNDPRLLHPNDSSGGAAQQPLPPLPPPTHPPRGGGGGGTPLASFLQNGQLDYPGSPLDHFSLLTAGDGDGDGEASDPETETETEAETKPAAAEGGGGVGAVGRCGRGKKNIRIVVEGLDDIEDVVVVEDDHA